MADDAAPVAPHSTQDAIWLPSLLRAAATYTTDPVHTDRFDAFILYFGITAIASTPTLNAYVQTLMPDATTWVDFISITQVTAAAPVIVGFTSGGDLRMDEAPATDGTLAAGTFLNIPLGRKIRVKIIIAGAGSYTFSLQRMLFKRRSI